MSRQAPPQRYKLGVEFPTIQMHQRNNNKVFAVARSAQIPLIPCTALVKLLLQQAFLTPCHTVCSIDAFVKVLPCGSAVGLLCLHGFGLPSWQPVLAANSVDRN